MPPSTIISFRGRSPCSDAFPRDPGTGEVDAEQTPVADGETPARGGYAVRRGRGVHSRRVAQVPRAGPRRLSRQRLLRRPRRGFADGGADHRRCAQAIWHRLAADLDLPQSHRPRTVQGRTCRGCHLGADARWNGGRGGDVTARRAASEVADGVADAHHPAPAARRAANRVQAWAVRVLDLPWWYIRADLGLRDAWVMFAALAAAGAVKEHPGSADCDRAEVDARRALSLRSRTALGSSLPAMVAGAPDPHHRGPWRVLDVLPAHRTLLSPDGRQRRAAHPHRPERGSWRVRPSDHRRRCLHRRVGDSAPLRARRHRHGSQADQLGANVSIGTRATSRARQRAPRRYRDRSAGHVRQFHGAQSGHARPFAGAALCAARLVQGCGHASQGGAATGGMGAGGAADAPFPCGSYGQGRPSRRPSRSACPDAQSAASDRFGGGAAHVHGRHAVPLSRGGDPREVDRDRPLPCRRPTSPGPGRCSNAG